MKTKNQKSIPANTIKSILGNASKEIAEILKAIHYYDDSEMFQINDNIEKVINNTRAKINREFEVD